MDSSKSQTVCRIITTERLRPSVMAPSFLRARDLYSLFAGGHAIMSPRAKPFSFYPCIGMQSQTSRYACRWGTCVRACSIASPVYATAKRSRDVKSFKNLCLDRLASRRNRPWISGSRIFNLQLTEIHRSTVKWKLWKRREAQLGETRLVSNVNRSRAAPRCIIVYSRKS